MKKLMIAAAIVCSAAFANAATYYWSVKSEEIYMPGTDYSDYVAEGSPAYLFMLTDSMTQQSVLDAWRDGTDISTLGWTKDLAASDNDGKIAATTFSTTVAKEGDSQRFFLAMVNDSQLLLTDDFGGPGSILPDAAKNITAETAYASGDLETLYGDKDWSAAAGNGGGYFTSAVPEPTSGLLLLLGVAGLALRRRRA